MIAESNEGVSRILGATLFLVALIGVWGLCFFYVRGKR
jgi:hypothetical protein